MAITKMSAECLSAFSSFLPYHMLLKASVTSLKEIYVGKHQILSSRISFIANIFKCDAPTIRKEKTNS
jgi:hypothetical protein